MEAPLILEDVLAARARIARYVHKTPLIHSSRLSKMLGCELYVKCENLQKTGAFKARGVMNFLLLNPGENTVTTYSSGNHGGALAWGAQQMGRKAMIFMPEDASPVKVSAVKGYGGDVRFAGLSSTDRYAACMDFVKETDAMVVPPYDHHHIIAGAGTAMTEVLEECPNPDAVLLPVGGGGLLAGNALTVHELRAKVKVFSCEPEMAADAKASLEFGTLQTIEYPPTIADGLRNLCVGDRNWEIIRKTVTGGLSCSEDAIRRAMAAYASFMKLYVEPSGAATLACLWTHKEQFAGQRVVIYLSGGNIAPWDYAKMVTQDVGTFE